ncbi:MAG: thiamine phosphate synthase [Candidatus Methanoplasma sp.]|jgi:thiamine-phosphate pyrophosphorylase|nr:thiamine phosphate synthase [Candidatus Methanoplasma sp.]
MFDLYVVTDSALSGGLPDSEVARRAYEGGADAVQLRMKGAPGGEMLRQARIIKGIADSMSRLFIVNDRADVALLSEADGVHLGRSDVPIEDARGMLGEHMIIGASVHSVEEAEEAAEAGADYLSVGSVFRTGTKGDAIQGLGLGPVFEIKRSVGLPLVAIGGINLGNVREVIRAGADSAAVASAVVSKPDIAKAAREMRDAILKARIISDIPVR